MQQPAVPLVSQPVQGPAIPLTPPVQPGCASGDMCGMIGTPMTGTHQCKSCKKKMHSCLCAKAYVEGGAMWCFICGIPENPPADLQIQPDGTINEV